MKKNDFLEMLKDMNFEEVIDFNITIKVNEKYNMNLSNNFNFHKEEK